MSEVSNKRSKISQENLVEAERLSKIWKNTYEDRRRVGVHSQGAFGDAFNIGNQAAVGFFLNGRTALSLKAAQGFAKGLGCKIEDFSPRLAAALKEGGQYTGTASTQSKEVEELQEVVSRLTTSGRMELTEVSDMIAKLKAREGH
jgi:hypothetical protein